MSVWTYNLRWASDKTKVKRTKDRNSNSNRRYSNINDTVCRWYSFALLLAASENDLQAALIEMDSIF